MITGFSKRAVDVVSFLICCGLIGFSLFLELHVGLNLCPLCVLQRCLFMLLAILFLFGSLVSFERNARRYFYVLILLAAGFGMLVAARHIWLQTHFLASGGAGCGADIGYLLQILPVNQVMKVIFQGTGECGKIRWEFLHLSIPMWSLVCFSFFTLLALWQICRKDRIGG